MRKVEVRQIEKQTDYEKKRMTQQMLLSDFIRVYHQAMPSGLCQTLIDAFEQDTEHQSKQEQDHEKFGQRRCTEINLLRGGKVWETYVQGLQQATHHAVKRYLQDCPSAVLPEEYGLEEYRLKCYDPFKDERFDYHVDVTCHSSAKRFLVIFWYLNTVDEGGETFFPGMNLKIKPVEGTLLMFPPMWMYPHAGLKPVSHTKYILGTYLHYR